MDLTKAQVAVDLLVKIDRVKLMLEKIRKEEAPPEISGCVRFYRVKADEADQMELRLSEKDLQDELDRLKGEFNALDSAEKE